MKTLQERMNDMKPYFRGIEMYNDALIVRVMLPQRWKAYNSNDGRIKATPSETVANEYFYYANSNDTTYEDIFDLIEETIKANNDIVLKLKLLRDKVEELKETMKTNKHTKFALVECDINGLKGINDTYGHEIGDVYIVNSCRGICSVFKHSPVFRIGGDEFVVILQGL